MANFIKKGAKIIDSVSVAGNGVQAYQISTPTSLPQGVVMATSGSLGSLQQVGEEASQKRELRLLKNRYDVSAIYGRLTEGRMSCL